MIEAVGGQAAVALVFRVDTGRVCSGSGVRFRVKDDDPGQGVGAVHEAGGAFDDFDGMDVVSVQFDAVFVTPLLAFLPDAVRNDDDPVVAEAADDRFRNTASG